MFLIMILHQKNIPFGRVSFWTLLLKLFLPLYVDSEIDQ